MLLSCAVTGCTKIMWNTNLSKVKLLYIFYPLILFIFSVFSFNVWSFSVVFFYSFRYPFVSLFYFKMHIFSLFYFKMHICFSFLFLDAQCTSSTQLSIPEQFLCWLYWEVGWRGEEIDTFSEVGFNFCIFHLQSSNI